MDETANHCVAQNGLSNLWFDFDTNFTQPMDVVLRDPVIHKALAEPGISGEIPTAPVHIYNGVTDEVNPIAPVDELVSSYCSGGTPVTYRREEFPPRPIPQAMSTHAVVLATGAFEAFAWLKDRMDRTAPKPSGCDIQTVPTTLLTPQALGVLSPSYIGNVLLAAIGVPIGSGR